MNSPKESKPAEAAARSRIRTRYMLQSVLLYIGIIILVVPLVTASPIQYALAATTGTVGLWLTRPQGKLINERAGNKLLFCCFAILTLVSIIVTVSTNTNALP